MKMKNSAPNSVAMKLKAPQSNPFETIWSRTKFDILGKKRKGEQKRIGLARSRAIQKRNATLLKEYEQSAKSSVFLDKRIGEQNDALGEFDKAILRSQRERQLKLKKKSKYNLSDGEEDEFEIEGVPSFSERDDFEDEIVPDDDDDDGAEGAGTEKKPTLLKQVNAHDMQNQSQRGLMEGEENKHKSKKEVMEEIISKSKFYKAQKAKDREENEHLVEELDKNFTSLVQSEALLSLTRPDKVNALKALVNKSIPNEYMKKDDVSTMQHIKSFKQEQPDSYDKLIGEMTLDMRARPSDRTKMPEEIAQEERERLERLEEERQKRMLAPNDSSDEEGDSCEDAVEASNQGLRSISGDDLGDSFSLDVLPESKKGWVYEVLDRKNTNELETEDYGSSEESESPENESDDEGFEKDNDNCEMTSSLKDWEQSDDDKLSTDLEGEEDEEGEQEGEEDDEEEEMVLKIHQKAKDSGNAEINRNNIDSLDAKKIKTNVKHPSSQQDSIPYVIKAPTSLEELCMLLENCSDSDIVEIIHRIRINNAISLAVENRKKMQVFYGVLLQYFAVLANKKPLNFKLLNLLVKPLMEISVEIPYFAAICARQRILRTRMQFCEAIKIPEKSSWPSLKTLFLLRLWSMIFPCSDFRHVVMTPATLLMCEYLMRCPILSGYDIAIGCFLCSMVLSVVKQSRKFCPEAIMFLRTLLMVALDGNSKLSQDSQFYFFMELKTLKPLLAIRGHVDDLSPLDFLTLMAMPEGSSFFSSDNFRACVLVSIIETLQGFVDIYGGYNSFPEIFLPISTLLLALAEQENMPNALKEKIRGVEVLIKEKTHEHHMLRQPLQMRKQKPVPIKLFNPKFEENFVKGRDYDPDRERAEQRKLKKLIKQEAKGAARELRKDNYFLFEVKKRDKAMQEEERAEKYGKARAFLQEQEHAFKSGQLGKGRKRRR